MNQMKASSKEGRWRGCARRGLRPYRPTGSGALRGGQEADGCPGVRYRRSQRARWPRLPSPCWCGAGGRRVDSALTDRMVRWWARVWLRAAGARAAVDGLESVASVAPCVMVSNHQSNLDPIVHLATLPLSLRVLAKREMFRIWLLGPAIRTIGMIEVDRDSPDFPRIDRAAARDLAGRALAAGRPGGDDLAGWHDRRLQGRRLRHRGRQPRADPAGSHPWHLPDLAAGAERDPWWPGPRRHRKPAADQRHDTARRGHTAGSGPAGHLLSPP
jgi:Acyltransferase